MPAKPLPPLGIAALAFLMERPMHPYEMYQLAIHRQEDRLMRVSPGSLYRAVYALEADGFVHATGTGRDGLRPERTTFEITDDGRALLAARITELLRTPVREYPLFTIAVAEAHAIGKDAVIAALEERLVHQRADLAALTNRLATIEELGVPRLYWVGSGLIEATLTAEIDWVEQTIGELRSGELPWEHSRPDLASTPHS